ncbi:hypothetical protein QNO07_06755 [Streptomyces sp. 549]|uniref:hypothetical protein n=1 Tax=Streptomyces sp. 549 TaxID=3049076 RepID=UPI0024C221B9|nr:hypothetical protein [Streptomyces sp. 549]MDK1473123.1 hypothetical protein [Streptomyces sp. 549]
MAAPLVLGGAPAVATAADTGGSGAPVALVGALADDGVSLENARFTVVAQPAPEIDEAVVVGETVPTQTLPAELVEAKGSEFVLRLRPDDLAEGFLSGDGLATVELEIYVPEKNAIATTMASFQLVGEGSGTTAEWAEPDGVSAARTVAVPEPIRVEMELHPLPKGAAERPAGGVSARTEGGVGAQSAITRLIKTSHRMATIGTSYPIGGQKATMFHGSGRTITYGAAVSYGSKWNASGDKSISNGYEFTWAPQKTMRAHRTQVRYGLYSHQNKDGIELYRRWRPIVETGVTKEKKLSKRPTWNKGKGVGKRCDTLPRGTWSRTNSKGKSYSLSTGVQMKKIIDIDLSTKRNYASNSKLTYELAKSTRRLCGNNEMPGLASKTAQYRS